MAAWPDLGDRPFTATHLVVDGFGPAEAEATQKLFARYGLECSSLAYYDNNLHPDPDTRSAVNDHVHTCIDAAAFSAARRSARSSAVIRAARWPRTSSEAEAVFRPLVDHAGQAGVKLIIENCVMEGWHPDGYPGNLAYSPELWEWMFSIGLYLNYDPSHLVWMGIDPVEAVRPYIDHIPHAQAKDIELDPAAQPVRLARPGCPARRPLGRRLVALPRAGPGQVDWNRLIDVLYEGGFDGVLSVEHEDPQWGGTEEKVEIGLDIAHRTLRPLIVA